MKAQTVGTGKKSWLDEEFKMPAPLPRIEPGRYLARSVQIHRRERYGRIVLDLVLEIMGGRIEGNVIPINIEGWPVLATLTCFFTYPGRNQRPSPQSKMGRTLAAMVEGTGNVRPDRLTYKTLLRKLWVVSVDDARPASGSPYSVVRELCQRVA